MKCRWPGDPSLRATIVGHLNLRAVVSVMVAGSQVCHYPLQVFKCCFDNTFGFSDVFRSITRSLPWPSPRSPHACIPSVLLLNTFRSSNCQRCWRGLCTPSSCLVCRNEVRQETTNTSKCWRGFIYRKEIQSDRTWVGNTAGRDRTLSPIFFEFRRFYTSRLERL